jgi:hypothetical protein
MSETRKLAAILIADIVGYSRLAGVDEERTLARLRALRSALGKARVAFIEVLDGYTLGDLVRSRTPLRALLAIAPTNAMPIVVGRRRSAQTKVDRRA